MRSHPVLPSLVLGLALLGGITALAYSANGRTAWAGTKELGVFRSTNNGRTWAAANSGLSGEVLDLAASPGAAG